MGILVGEQNQEIIKGCRTKLTGGVGNKCFSTSQESMKANTNFKLLRYTTVINLIYKLHSPTPW